MCDVYIYALRLQRFTCLSTVSADEHLSQCSSVLHTYAVVTRKIKLFQNYFSLRRRPK